MGDNNNNQGYDPQQYGGQGYDQSQQYAQQGYDQSQQYAQQGYDQSQQYAQQGYDQSQQYVQQGYDQSQQYAQQTQQYVQQGYAQSQQYAQQGYDQSQQYAQQTQQYAQQGYDQSQQYAQQGYDQSQQYAQQGYDQSQQYVQQGYDQSQQYAQQSFNQAQQTQQNAQQIPQNTQQTSGGAMQYKQPDNLGQSAFEKPQEAQSGQQPPVPGDDSPKKPVNKGLIIGLISAAVLIVAAVLLIFVFDVFGTGARSPKECAETFMEAWENLDASKMNECFAPEVKGHSSTEIQEMFDEIKNMGVTCSDKKVGEPETLDVDEAKEAIKREMKTDVKAKEAAKVRCSITMNLLGQSEETTFDVIVVKQGKRWYVASFDETEGDTEPDTEATTEDNTEDITTDTEATTEDIGTVTPPSGTGHDAVLWTWNFDDDKWSFKEDKFTDNENQSSLVIGIPKADDPEKYSTTIEVDARINETYTFRDDLYTYGIDEHDYVDGNVPTAEVGGVECIKHEGSYWGSDAVTYLARLEGAKETIKIKVYGDDIDDPAVQAAIDGLTFKVTDIGNVDGPWYWEGEPFDAPDANADIGSVSISTKLFKMSDPYVTHETFDHSIAYADSSLYVLSKDVIRKYTIGETGIELAEEYQLDDEYKRIMSTDDGRIFLSGFTKPLTEWKDGEIIQAYTGDADYIYMDPTGSFGISYFTSGEKTAKVTLSGDTLQITPMPFNEVDTIMHLNISKDHIFVCGTSSDEEEKGHKVFVYDTEGNFVMKLQKNEDASIGLGSITYVAETDNGFMGMDGNLRSVEFWDKDGNYIGGVKDKEIFGTKYPWFCDSVVTPEGSIYTLMTDERADKSADEVVIFQINGF